MKLIGEREKPLVLVKKLPHYPAHKDLQLIYDSIPEIAKIWTAIKTLPGSVSRNAKKKITERSDLRML